MSRDCPDCGDPLIKTKGGEFTCIQCGYHVDEEDAPPATGSPLPVRASQDTVTVEAPDPRRHMDNNPVRLNPDGARRFAEALEQAADDAERRGDDDSDGGTAPDHPDTPAGGADR